MGDLGNLEYAGARIQQLDAQLHFLVDYMNDLGLLDDGCFTFPDGETVHATQTLTGDNNEDREQDAGDFSEDSEEEEAIHLREAQGD